MFLMLVIPDTVLLNMSINFYSIRLQIFQHWQDNYLKTFWTVQCDTYQGLHLLFNFLKKNRNFLLFIIYKIIIFVTSGKGFAHRHCKRITFAPHRVAYSIFCARISLVVNLWRILFKVTENPDEVRF